VKPSRAWARPWLLGATLALGGCGEQTLDAGFDVPHGLLPIDERNPVVLSNDGTGNWFGLYAVLFANSGGPALLGIAVNSSSYATNLSDNLAAWQTLVSAAHDSGLEGIPEPIASSGAPLARPTSSNIDDTAKNGSEGARMIVDAATRSGSPERPLVVVAGGRLTDVADAYLLDHGIAERVIVVAALGSSSTNGGAMGAPNGELDPWADWIVTHRLRYVQVSAYYDATLDLPDSALSGLAMNPLGALVKSQAPDITDVPTQADQVAILAAGLPEFVRGAERVAVTSTSPSKSSGPELAADEGGSLWLVTAIDPAKASTRLVQMLTDPAIFGP
jgi:hypothetical protein